MPVFKAKKHSLSLPIFYTFLLCHCMTLAIEFVNRDNTGKWSDGSNWSSYVPPVLDDPAMINNHTVTLDYQAPDIAFLNLGCNNDLSTPTVLNITDGGSLTTHNKGGWDMIGGMNSGTAELNMTGNSKYTVKGKAIWNHHSTDLTAVNIGPKATMIVENQAYFESGNSITNLHGLLRIKRGVQRETTTPGKHNIHISPGGKLQINAATFTEQNAKDTLKGNFPLFTISGDDVTVANIHIEGQTYRQFTGGLWLANCTPANESNHVDPKVELSWNPLQIMKDPTYNIYMGLTPDTLQQVSRSQKGTSFKPTPNLKYLTKYFWRVDVNQNSNILKGNLRNFTTGAKAWSPHPANKTIGVTRDSILSWKPDSFARTFGVYLGTNKYSVATADKDSKQFHTTVQIPKCKSSLKLSTDYYWRIDQRDSEGKLIAKGDVWCFSTCPPPSRTTKGPKLTISEIMAANEVNPGWIEIYNPSPTTIDLSDWYITDDLKKLKKCRFHKGLKIQPNDYLLVTASNKNTRSFKDENGFDHINLDLNKSGGRLALVKSSGFTVKKACEFEYPSQKQDISYGLYDNEAYFFTEPTPAKDNTHLGSFQARTWYVSTTGNDANPGTLAKPFRTIAKASNIMKPGNTCILRGGTYRETLVPVTSGKPYAPITYTSYPGETAVINGTEQITDWSIHKENIYRAPMNWSIGPGRNQVFVNGAEMIEARYPSTDPSDPENFYKPNTMPVQCLRGEPYVVGANLDQPENHWQGAYFWGKIEPYWHAQCAKVVGSEPGRLTVTGKNYTWFPEWSDWAYPNMHGHGGGFIYGVLNALDIEREWCVQDSHLYLYAPGGGDPSSRTVEAKKRIYVADLQDKSYVRLKGMDLFCGSLRIEGDHNTIENCNAKYFSHRLYTTRGGGESFDGWTINGSYNTIKACKMEYALNTALQIRGSYNTVQNCIINDISRSGYYDTAVVLGGGVTGGKTGHHNRIECNTMYKSGRMLILPGGHTDTIRYNDLYHSEYYRLTDDCGVIYGCLADGRGTEIAYNICHDNHSHLSATGIYFDDGSRNYLIHHNVVYNCQNGVRLGTFHRPTFGTRVFNNTFWVSSTPVATHGGNGLSDTLVYNNLGPSNRFAGTDVKNNLTVDSMSFINPASHDFRLSINSNAIDKGKIITGITGVYKGTAPDAGAFEKGLPPWSAGHNATVPAPDDKTSPSPDPLTWKQNPKATGYTTVSMTAASVTDESPVAYYFECTSGNGHDSGWQDSPKFQDSDLEPNKTYSYRVKASDKSPAYNETKWSAGRSVTTPQMPPKSPKISNLKPTDLKTKSARLNGIITAGYPYPEVKIYYGDKDGGKKPSNWDKSVNAGSQRSVFSFDILGLKPDNIYYYTFLAKNSQGKTWMTTKSFTTPKYDYDPSLNRTFSGKVDQSWNNPFNWEPYGVPGKGSWAHIKNGNTVVIDCPVSTVSLFTLNHNDRTNSTLNITDSGSMTCTQDKTDWTMIGGGRGKSVATLNMTGKSSLTLEGANLIVSHGSEDSQKPMTYMNIGPDAKITVSGTGPNEGQVYYYNGNSHTNLEGTITVERGLVWGSGKHAIKIIGNGKFRVKQSTYSIEKAKKHIASGKFTPDKVTAKTVNIDGTVYTEISLP